MLENKIREEFDWEIVKERKKFSSEIQKITSEKDVEINDLKENLEKLKVESSSVVFKFNSEKEAVLASEK